MKQHRIFIIFFALLAVLAVAFSAFSYFHGVTISANSSVLSCVTGQTKECVYDGCSGVETCFNGVWSGCNWQQICIPGSKASCLVNGCATSFKMCDSCGTGYSACLSQ